MFPFTFIKPPEKFELSGTDVRKWIKEFDLFIKSHNITNNKMIVLTYSSNETRHIIENMQFNYDDNVAYQEFYNLMIQLYCKRQTPETELKRKF